MKYTALFLVTIALASCQGLSLIATPDGGVSGSYVPPLPQPPAPVVIQDTSSK